MKKKAFTLAEILITLVVIGILATLGIPAYKNAIEDSKAKVCKVNLEALSVALQIYAMEHDVMPGNLSRLSPGYIQKAYARILQRKGGWKIRLAYYIVGWEERGFAYAGLLNDLARGDKILLTCPAVSPAATRSYGMNEVLAGITSEAYKALPETTILIADCDIAEFTSESELKAWHKHFDSIYSVTTYAQSIKKDKEIKKHKK